MALAQPSRKFPVRASILIEPMDAKANHKKNKRVSNAVLTEYHHQLLRLSHHSCDNSIDPFNPAFSSAQQTSLHLQYRLELARLRDHDGVQRHHHAHADPR